MTISDGIQAFAPLGGSPAMGDVTDSSTDNAASDDARRVTVMPELMSIVESQRRAFFREGPPSVTVRKDRLDRLVLLLTEHAEAFAEALAADFGNRPRAVTYVSDIAAILPDIALTRTRLAAWMKPRRVHAASLFGLPTAVHHQPLGVVGIIGPWNVPIGLVAHPAAAAFAAGNRVMVKFSEVTPLTAELFAATARTYFSIEEFAVVTGGVDVGAEFSALPFDHLFFTGSPEVGALVAQAAAANLVPVTLELGGKNPAIVDRNADIRQAAGLVMSARMVNGGQLCLCPDVAFVPRARIDEFVEAAVASARATFPVVTAEHGPVSIVNEQNFDRIVGLIEDARAKGALVIDAASPDEPLPNRSARRIAPTLVRGATEAMAITQEEVFGPVLSVHPYDTIDEVVDYLQARPSPLASYWFGPTGADFETFRRLVTSGGMTVNDFAAHCAMLSAPFGGVGRSGFGAYHGRAGFDAFTHRRVVTRNRLPVSLAKLAVAPYSAGFTRAVERYMEYERKKAAKRRRHGKN